MNKIFVFGVTDKREVYIVSNNRRFYQNEYFIIEDTCLGNIAGEVIETNSYALADDSTLPKGCTVSELYTLDDFEKENVNIAKLRILETLQVPITPSSKVREPQFEEIKKFLIPTEPKKGLLLGVINGTEKLQEDIPSEYCNIAPLWEKGKAVKQKGVPLSINHRTFREYPGIGLFGGSGSGKTYGLRVICEEFMEKDIPAIALDPHSELEFEETMHGLDSNLRYDYKNKYKIFEVGKNIGIKFTELTVSELQSLIEFADPLSQPMAVALNSLYEKGDTFSHLTNKVKDLKEALDVYENRAKGVRDIPNLTENQEVLYRKYKSKVAGSNTLQGLLWRLEGLESTGIFNNDILSLEKALKSRKLAVIRGSNFKILMISSYIFKKLYYKRRNFKDGIGDIEAFPPFFIISDEAHFVAPADSQTPTKRILKEISQEARKYGVYQVLCTQRPSLLDPTIVSQLSTKCIFSTKDVEDIKVLAKEANLDEDSVRSLPYLNSGNCFVSSATLDKTFSIRFRTTKTEAPHQEDVFDELDRLFSVFDKELGDAIIDKLPFTSMSLHTVHSYVNAKLNKSYTYEDFNACLKSLISTGEVDYQTSAMGISYKRK
ncbi:ATP-binding protein [Clostridium perfringens]|uniref:Putative cell division FtsK/SpoIIIE n=1 Tax=Clostridium perfringens TaxID=1502 RepID=A0A140GS79_CLOPF|nr:ATP-binding protein [Clostridium perfringens]AMN31388.1 putative cell division FtsK/SpoIIIE [Clostridium perfringens]